MTQKSAVEKVQAFSYKGELYENEEAARHQEALDNLFDFLDAEGAGGEGGWDRDTIFNHLQNNFEKYISLLNRLY